MPCRTRARCSSASVNLGAASGAPSMISRGSTARPLATRAVELIEARGNDADPQELADGRYLIARAMWDAKQDRVRARALAARAQAEEPDAVRQQVVAAWLRAHPL